MKVKSILFSVGTFVEAKAVRKCPDRNFQFLSMTSHKLGLKAA